jgi:hypothetical protein
MVVIRNVFHLKFGKAREALALVKESVAIHQRAGAQFSPRIMTDLTGPFYTIVLEITLANLAYLETEMPRFMSSPEWQANYQKLAALVESGHREMYRLVE